MNRRNFLIKKLKVTGVMALLPRQSIVLGQFENYKSQILQCNSIEKEKNTFKDDLDFLQKHTQTVVLKSDNLPHHLSFRRGL